MNLKIFRDAFNLYQAGLVKVVCVGGRTASFIVDKINVRIDTTAAGLKFYCGCEAHMKRMAQDKLCKRTIAALVYIARQKKMVQSAFVDIASEMSRPHRVWVLKATDSRIDFDVDGKKLWVERIPTGTRVRTIKDDKTIQDNFTIEMVAAILFIYDHRGKIIKR